MVFTGATGFVGWHLIDRLLNRVTKCSAWQLLTGAGREAACLYVSNLTRSMIFSFK